MAKGYKRYTLSQAIDIIKSGGLRGMTINELRSVGRPLMTETRRRMKELRQAGYTKSPAYKAYKDLGLKTSTSTENRNMLLTEVFNAYTFLTAKTGSTEGVEKYLELASKRFNRDVTLEEANLIWAALDILRKEYPKIYESFSYNITIEEVAFQGKEMFSKLGEKASARDVGELALEILKDVLPESAFKSDETDLLAFDDSPLWDKRRF